MTALVARALGCSILAFLSTPALGYQASWVRSIDCSHSPGTRLSRGEILQSRRDKNTAFLEYKATRIGKACHLRADLVVSNERRISLPTVNEKVLDYYIVGWSPDGQTLAAEADMSSIDMGPDRSVPDIRLLTVRRGGRTKWLQVEALFADQEGWRGCSVYYQLTGWTPSGAVVVEVTPGSLIHRPPDCVKQKSYWSVNVSTGKLEALGPQYTAATGAREVRAPFRPCKEDPDIIAACFVIHGRLSYYNGNPSVRIWRIGTTRVLGVWDDELPMIPDSIWKKFDPEKNAAFGDFEVCPFTKEKPDAMQYVCVESFKNIVTHN